MLAALLDPIMQSTNKCKRILWNGELFGRLTKAGRNHLVHDAGWSYLDTSPPPHDDDTNHLPLAFIWPNKSGPQFATNVLFPALVRPFPTHATNEIDDKILLDKLMRQYGTSQMMPVSIDADEIIEKCDNEKLFFVKHRSGAQGKSVYVHTKDSLIEWKDKCRNPLDFIIQEEVQPALDENGKKFVLRAHILICNFKASSSRDNVKNASNSFLTALHEDVICHTHSVEYDKHSMIRSIHISNQSKKKKKGGKSDNNPAFIADLPSSHPAHGVFDEMKRCTSKLSDAFIKEMVKSGAIPIHPSVTCFELLGADFLVAADSSLKLCEVNSHPALGWGTMSDVPSEIYERLVKETLSILLLDANIEDTGFVSVH
jgi:hypothetical protein